MNRRLSAPLSDAPLTPTETPTPGMPVIPNDLEAEAIARRRLLKLAAYTVPLVVGTMIAGRANARLSDEDQGCLNSHPGSNPNCD